MEDDEGNTGVFVLFIYKGVGWVSFWAQVVDWIKNWIMELVLGWICN